MKKRTLLYPLLVLLLSNFSYAKDWNNRGRNSDQEEDSSYQKQSDSNSGCFLGLFCSDNANSDNNSDEVGPMEIPVINQGLSAKIAPAFEKAKDELRAVEKIYDDGDYGKALRVSKDLLDQIKSKTGINPKAKFREKILVKGIFTRGSKNELKTNFVNLRNEQKEALAEAVNNHLGGFYLDLLNLYKRTTLIYIKSFYQKIKQMGDLRQRDIDKIKRDLALIHDISILVKDQNLQSSFILFDSDVADSDQQYFFNRELVDFILEVKEISFDEKAFSQFSLLLKNSELDQYRAGLLPEPLSAVEKRAQVRLEKAREKAHGYARCKDAASLFSNNPKNEAPQAKKRRSCFYKYKNTANLSFTECMSMASYFSNNPKNGAPQAYESVKCHDAYYK